MTVEKDPEYGDALAEITAEQQGLLVDDLQALQRCDRMFPADDPHIEELERRLCDRSKLITKMKLGVMFHASQ